MAVEKGFFLCGLSVALYTMRYGPLVVRRLMCAAWTVFANVNSAIGGVSMEKEEGFTFLLLDISKFLAESSSTLWNRVFMRTL